MMQPQNTQEQLLSNDHSSLRCFEMNSVTI